MECILCGDFNSPKEELADGSVVAWGNAEQQEAELAVLTGLQSHGVRDLYRELHGFPPKQFSWIWKGGAGAIGRRFDHVFASGAFEPVAFRYLDELRLSGLSDHAPALATLRWREG
jgi:exonuclease III